MEIPIGRVGRILKGRGVGAFVKVVDDAENTGGYLILTGRQADFLEGYDNWVEDGLALQQYFVEAGWMIEWL